MLLSPLTKIILDVVADAEAVVLDVVIVLELWIVIESLTQIYNVLGIVQIVMLKNKDAIFI